MRDSLFVNAVLYACACNLKGMHTLEDIHEKERKSKPLGLTRTKTQISLSSILCITAGAKV